MWAQLGLPIGGIGQDQPHGEGQSVSNSVVGEREKGARGTPVAGGSFPEAESKSPDPHVDISPEKRSKQSLRFEAWRLARRRDLGGVRQLLANMKAGELQWCQTLEHPRVSSKYVCDDFSLT
jgi:hypothetical protein